MLAASLTLVGDVLFQGGGPAWAVVGRPMTPVSYAGVARRTTRRTVTRTSYAAGTVTALPAGCVSSGGQYRCGTVSYRAYYDGPNLVYVPL